MSALLKLVPTWCWALVAGLALCGLQQIRVVGLEGDLAAASSLERESDRKLTACRVTRTSLLEQAIEQNKAMAGLREQAAQRAATAKHVQAAAQLESQADYQAANRIQRERTGGDTCGAAEIVIDQ